MKKIVYVNKIPEQFENNSNAEYKKVNSILVAIEPKIVKLNDCRYGKKSDVYLFKLGKTICEKIRWKIFKIGLTKLKGRVYSFY